MDRYTKVRSRLFTVFAGIGFLFFGYILTPLKEVLPVGVLILALFATFFVGVVWVIRSLSAGHNKP